MLKTDSVKLVRETFESPFEKKRFIKFVKNLLNEYEEAEFTRTGNLVRDAFQDYVSKFERVGKYIDDEKHRIDILIVHLKKETAIERARSMQRNFIAGYLQGHYGTDADKDAALVAFVSPDGKDWRFSLVKLEVRLEATPKGHMKPVDEFTPARRWSFLVGIHEKSHTAQSRLVPIISDDEHNPTLEDLEEAFNIEKVTKEFFGKYRDLFIRAKGELDKAVAASPKTKTDFESKGVDTVNLAKKLLGQIIFLYYLQKKGWFGVPREGKWGEGSKNFLRELFEKKHGDYKNFFNDILEPLFYEALRMDRSHDDHYYSRFDCKIPFLNGGLFDPMNNYDWVKTDLLLPNELFHNETKINEVDAGDGILDIFDRYNFTVKEDEPFEKEVAIDPELLGKAYEKFNAIRPDNFGEYIKALNSGKKGEESKFNKQHGVYYTPREIVHYMCQQSLINYLASELDGKASKEDLTVFVQTGENLREHEAQAALKETKTYSPKLPDSIRQNAQLIDEKLAAIRVCDPAVGSGAFPVGMMSEVVKARQALESYAQSTRTVYDFKRECIENSLYGVDIDAGAVEIAKLRLWLSLIVDEDDIQNIKPLPNLDYKIACGNSLLGVEKNLFNFNLFTELENLKLIYFNATNPTEKQEYKKRIDRLIEQITNGHAQFDFEIHFSEVFHEKGGFDILITNPPYLGNKGHKDEFQIIQKGYLGQYYERRMDLLYFFFHLALNLSKEGASIAFITTNYYPTATGGRKLRKDFRERAIIRNLVNFNEFKIFESALGQHNMITILEKANNKDAFSENCIIQNQGFATPEILQQIFENNNKETTYYKVAQKDLYDGDEYYIRLAGNFYDSTNTTQIILEKLKKQGELLGNICNVNQGIVTGANKVTEKHLARFKINALPGDGIYVLSPREIKEKRISVNSEHVKKWFKNSDIQKYWTNTSEKEYVLYFKDKKEKQFIEKEILEHFAKYKELLIERLSVCKKNEFQWNIVSKWIDRGEYYLLFYPRKQEIFESPKIVVSQRSPRNIFGFNEIPWYAASDVYFITQQDKSIALKYVLAHLNSKLVYLWLYHRGKRKGEILEMIVKPLSEIPIKKIPDDEQKSFIKLVDRILAAKRANPQADTSALEREIDKLVYHLYGLTEEEIKIVEKKI